MDVQGEITKIIVGFLISLLIKLIPFLGVFTGPLGWIVSFFVGKATGWLYDLIQRFLKFKAIEADVAVKLQAAKAAIDGLKAAQTNNVSKEDHDAALAKFRAACMDLGRIKLR